MLDKPTLITNDFRKNALARAIPYAYFGDGGWYLPPDPDPESCRVSLKLFPGLAASEPELVAAARLSAADFAPIDLASAAWDAAHWNRIPQRDPWQRVRASCLAHDIVPHKFQRIDAQYAIDNLDAGKGAYFGWEMGLGKTLGACMVIDGWDANFVFIACPNSAKQDPWAQELRRFCPWLEPVVVGNTAATRIGALAIALERMERGEPTALICHYEAVRLIEGENKRGWKRFGRWDLLISDEAHLYKNRTAKFTASCRRLDAVGRLNLSGSVMSGRAEDLFVPWQMFQPKRYRSQWRDWNDKYLESFNDDYGRRHITGPMLHRLPEFRAELGEVLTVRLAKDWLDVPEPHIVERGDLVMHPEQARVYREIADELMAELPDGEIMYATDGAPLRSALRQITAGVPTPCLLHTGVCTGHGGVLCSGLISAKHDAAMTDIENAGDSQIVMFAWHKRAVYELQRRCLAAGIPCGVVCGDFGTAQREATIDLFKRGGYRVLVATIATLSQAVNLQNASVVGMLEESDDPVLNEQAIARVIRQGQTVHASLFRYRIKDSVDDLSVASNALSKAELRRLILGA